MQIGDFDKKNASEILKKGHHGQQNSTKALTGQAACSSNLIKSILDNSLYEDKSTHRRLTHEKTNPKVRK